MVHSRQVEEMSRLFDKIEAGELALGVYIKGGPHLVAALAKAEFDFVRPDIRLLHSALSPPTRSSGDGTLVKQRGAVGMCVALTV